MNHMLAVRRSGTLAFFAGLLVAGVVAAGLAVLAPARLDAVDALGTPGDGFRPDLLPGPVPARTLRVIDGDTLEVRAAVWVGQTVDVAVRLRGVDAPEIRGACDRERMMARKAQVWLDKMVGGADVTLTRIEGDKYFGRVIADITTKDGRAVGPHMLAAGLARRYDGGSRSGWCKALQ